MPNEQPIIGLSPMVRLPQLPPQQVATKRQQYATPVLTRYTVRRRVAMTPTPVTPMPRSPIEVRLPNTPPPGTRYISAMRTPYPRNLRMPGRSVANYYIPPAAKREEAGMGETLLGCGVLFVVGVLVVAVLYYLSSAM